MDKYLFRGQEITGLHAYSLLRAIQLVQRDAPNPTAEEIQQLQGFVHHFEQQFMEDLQEPSISDRDTWDE